MDWIQFRVCMNARKLTYARGAKMVLQRDGKTVRGAWKRGWLGIRRNKHLQIKERRWYSVPKAIFSQTTLFYLNTFRGSVVVNQVGVYTDRGSEWLWSNVNNIITPPHGTISDPSPTPLTCYFKHTFPRIAKRHVRHFGFFYVTFLRFFCFPVSKFIIGGLPDFQYAIKRAAWQGVIVQTGNQHPRM